MKQDGTHGKPDEGQNPDQGTQPGDVPAGEQKPEEKNPM